MGSQSESGCDRAVRRATKIRQRLGSDPDIAAPFPERPKGMWQQTYQRLCEQALETEVAADEAYALSLGRLLGRIDKLYRKRSFWR
jgi:hypothetical protein